MEKLNCLICDGAQIKIFFQPSKILKQYLKFYISILNIEVN